MQKKTYCLRMIDLYKTIPENKFVEIAEGTIDEYFSPKKNIYSEGEVGSCVYMLKEGEVELYKTENGKIIILETLFPGDTFGDFGTGIYNHSARAVRRSYICQTPTHEFLSVIKEYPEVILRLMQVMAERTQEYENKIAILSSPAKEQLLYTIKKLYEKNNQRFLQKIINLPFKISHQQLADKTGLNRVTVTKLMKQLQDDGSIYIDEKTRVIEVKQN